LSGEGAPGSGHDGAATPESVVADGGFESRGPLRCGASGSDQWPGGRSGSSPERAGGPAARYVVGEVKTQGYYREWVRMRGGWARGGPHPAPTLRAAAASPGRALHLASVPGWGLVRCGWRWSAVWVECGRRRRVAVRWGGCCAAVYGWSGRWRKEADEGSAGRAGRGRRAGEGPGFFAGPGDMTMSSGSGWEPESAHTLRGRRRWRSRALMGTLEGRC